jgi:excinuclease ABC subunit A
MHFLPDVYVTCDVCRGRRYNRETLESEVQGQERRRSARHDHRRRAGVLQGRAEPGEETRNADGRGPEYIKLGQNATTLSGGEAQRIKLAKELSRRDTGQTLYILDEPTTGLHFHDVAQLLKVLERLREHGNTIVIIEHNLDVIKRADWIIDLGPEGGSGGGEIIAAGTPEDVAPKSRARTPASSWPRCCPRSAPARNARRR